MLSGVNEDFWKFVNDNRAADVPAMRLKWHGKSAPGFDVEFAITQVECRRRFGKKLDTTLSSDPRFLFPDVLAGEQSTSDALAMYHSTLVPPSSRVCDLTAGLGIDSMHISQKASALTAVEIDSLKAEVLGYNSAGRFIVCCADCRDFITQTADNAFDVVFIDPHRRGKTGERVFGLEQCAPDVTAMLPKLRRIADTLIVKASPMLDITRMASVLPGTRRVIALGTPTECKELIAVVDLKDDSPDYYSISAVTIDRDGAIRAFDFTPGEERDAASVYGTPVVGDYVYEPSPSIMKAAPYNLVTERYRLPKISANTHVYFSEKTEPGFDGSIYRLERVIPYESKYLKRLHKEFPRLNVAARNFGMSAEDLRRKLKVSDGGALRLLAVTLADGAKSLLLLSPA